MLALHTGVQDAICTEVTSSIDTSLSLEQLKSLPTKRSLQLLLLLILLFGTKGLVVVVCCVDTTTLVKRQDKAKSRAHSVTAPLRFFGQGWIVLNLLLLFASCLKSHVGTTPPLPAE